MKIIRSDAEAVTLVQFILDELKYAEELKRAFGEFSYVKIMAVSVMGGTNVYFDLGIRKDREQGPLQGQAEMFCIAIRFALQQLQACYSELAVIDFVRGACRKAMNDLIAFVREGKHQELLEYTPVVSVVQPEARPKERETMHSD